jgi:hypothetical protein
VDTDLKAYRLDLGKYLYLAGADEMIYFDLLRDTATDSEGAHAITSLAEAEGWRDQLKIVYHAASSPQLKALLAERLENVAVMSDSDLQGFEDQPLKALTKVLIRTVDRELLVPYKYFGAVIGNRFFGRQFQLDAIKKHAHISYLVTGTRMSGKSSLLLQARREIDPAAGFHGAHSKPISVYIDCKRYSSFAGMINAILVELAERKSVSDIQKWTNKLNWPRFFRYLRSHAGHSPGKRLFLFLDEYDRVVEFDEKEHADITWNFRALQQNNTPERGIIQFIIAGSKTLAGLCKNQNSAFHNFLNYEDCRLDNFDVGTVKQVVRGPFEDLGFELDDAQRIASEMLVETAGRPSSVQFVCDQAVKRLIARKETVLTAETIRAFTQSSEYIQFHKEAVFENTDPLDQFILCVQAHSDRRSFTEEDIRKECEMLALYVEPKVLFASLSDLVNSGFLIRDEESYGELRYEIATPVIREIFRHQHPKWFVRPIEDKGLGRVFA